MIITPNQNTIDELEKVAEKCLTKCLQNKVKIQIPKDVFSNWENIMQSLLDQKKHLIFPDDDLYFLFGEDEKLLYVGKKKGVYNRLKEHLVKCSSSTSSKLEEFIEYVKSGNYVIYFATASVKPIGLNAFCEVYLQNKYNFDWVHRKG